MAFHWSFLECIGLGEHYIYGLSICQLPTVVFHLGRLTSLDKTLEDDLMGLCNRDRMGKVL